MKTKNSTLNTTAKRVYGSRYKSKLSYLKERYNTFKKYYNKLKKSKTMGKFHVYRNKRISFKVFAENMMQAQEAGIKISTKQLAEAYYYNEQATAENLQASISDVLGEQLSVENIRQMSGAELNQYYKDLYDAMLADGMEKSDINETLANLYVED